MTRYVVTEIEGFTDARPTRVQELSCMVVDVPWNRRVVMTYRTDDYGGPRDHRYALVRNHAARRAAKLNGTPPPPLHWRTCVRGHALTPENTYVSSTTGSLTCKLCQRGRRRAARNR